ncbi:uncharacterized protein TNCV_3867551 [Trichonephila clavipes]|nr:uncharacterized protein TNCV_3867551 [Trichonephila clavipes]
MQSRLGDKMFADVVMFKSMFQAVLMTISSVERALLVKLFHQNKGNASAAVGEFPLRKSLRRGPMSTNCIRAMIKKFEEKGKLEDQPVEEAVNVSHRTIRKALRNIMHYFPFKIRHTQELFDRDKPQCLSFSVNFLNRMTVDLSWPWNILRSDEAHFYLNGTVNTQNCHIWAKENPRIRTEILYSLQSHCLLWGYLKSLHLGGVATLNDLKNSITLHVRSLTTDLLRSAVEQTVHRIEILNGNEVLTEPLSLHGPGHD